MRAQHVSRTDRLRQVTVTLGAAGCAIGTLYGFGVLGTEVSESSGGRLSADATLLAPASTAFSIWSVIYLGLAAFTVWQWLPAAATSPRARAIGWLAAASMLLNAGWLLVAQAGWLLASVAVILTLLGVLFTLVRRLSRAPARGGASELVAVDGTFGLYLGWVSVASFANLAAALPAPAADRPSGVAQAAAVLAIAAVAGVGVLLARLLGARVAVAVAMAWGLGWIAVGRIADAPNSTATAIAAIVAAVLVVAALRLVRVPARP